jgi:hypothetical protein
VTIGGGPLPPCGEAAAARPVNPKKEMRHRETLHTINAAVRLRLSGCRRFGAAQMIGAGVMSRDVTEKTGQGNPLATRCCIFSSFEGGGLEVNGEE